MKSLRRSKLEIDIDILEVLAHYGPLKLTHVMYKVNLNCSTLKQFLNFLTEQKLIEEQSLSKKKRQKTLYVITERGKIALAHFKEIRRAFQTAKEPQRPYVFI